MLQFIGLYVCAFVTVVAVERGKRICKHVPLSDNYVYHLMVRALDRVAAGIGNLSLKRVNYFY